jgi:hypothetical protein
MKYFKKTLELGLKLALALVVLYVVLVLGFVWWHCYKSPLKGGANGQLDAYRHTFASAVVSYTASPKVVMLVSNLMEYKNSPANLMDKHNNAIGISIGQQVKSLDEIDAIVVDKVKSGKVNATDSMQITWLPPRHWGRGFLW